MKPIKLDLHNFIGIRAGLNRESLTVDLESLAGDAQLVALVGPNGAGKSTVLDNLHPYRIQPSRAGGYSPGSFSYYDHVTGPEAKKELVWEHAGRRYRSVLLFKTGGKTKKTEAYCFALDGSDWLPASAPDGTVSDGKADTYDRIVEAILGSPEMFFTSAFSCQGRRSLSSYANGEIKGLLSELLGLDHLRALGDKAKEVGAGLRMRLEAMRGDLTRAAEVDAGLSQAKADLATAEAAVMGATMTRNDARIATAAATRKMADMQAESRGNTEIEIKRKDLAGRIAQAETRLARTRDQFTRDVAANETRIRQEKEAMARDLAVVERQMGAARQQIAQVGSTLARAGEVATAREAAPGLKAELATAEAALVQARANSTAAAALRVEMGKLSSSLAGLVNEGKHLADHCAGLQTRAGLIATVPCQGSDMAHACPLLRDANTAQAGLAEAEARTTGKREEYIKAKADLAGLQVKLDALGTPDQTVTQTEAALATLQRRQRDNDNLLALAPTIAQADAIKLTARDALEALDKSTHERRAAADRAVQQLLQDLETLRQRAEADAAEAKAEMAALDAQLVALPPPADTTALTQAEQAATQAEAALAKAEQDLSALHTRIGGAKERIAQLDKQSADLAGFRGKAAHLEAEMGHWSSLAKAFGNDGIIALSIDDAGPTLAAYANDLLLSCYGPRFSVAIRTQTETAKGDMKETFDIAVFDGDRGDEKSVRDMSGGERIWVNEALTRAIALYQGQMHGRHYECLFADESDGALDSERKAQFMRMKRRVLELGGHQQEIFISHTPELWEMADAVIDMKEFMA